MTSIRDYGFDPESGYCIPDNCLQECWEYSQQFFDVDFESWNQLDYIKSKQRGMPKDVDIFVFGTAATKQVYDALRREGLSLNRLFNPCVGDNDLAFSVRSSRRERPWELVAEVGMDASLLAAEDKSEAAAENESVAAAEELSETGWLAELSKPDPPEQAFQIVRRLILGKENESVAAAEELSETEWLAELSKPDPPEQAFQIVRRLILGKLETRRIPLYKLFESAADMDFPEEPMQWAFEVEILDLIAAITELLGGGSDRKPDLSVLHPRDWETRKLDDDMSKWRDEPKTTDNYPYRPTVKKDRERIHVDRWLYWHLRARKYSQSEVEAVAKAKFRGFSVARKTNKESANRYATWVGQPLI